MLRKSQNFCDAVLDVKIQRMASSPKTDVLTKVVGRSAVGLFTSLKEARVVIAQWVTDYNNTRPHSSLGYLTPGAHAAKLKAMVPLPTPVPGFRSQPHCPTRATGRKLGRDSTPRWMKVRRQISRATDGQERVYVTKVSSTRSSPTNVSRFWYHLEPG